MNKKHIPFEPSLRYSDAEVAAGPCDGLITLTTWKYGRQPWAQAARTQRKTHRCVLCGKETTKEDRLYRPLANTANRMDRACGLCIKTRVDLT